MVKAHPGYCLVGADVDAEELWIASPCTDTSNAYLHQLLNVRFWADVRLVATARLFGLLKCFLFLVSHGWTRR
jgi:hypothetical protein